MAPILCFTLSPPLSWGLSPPLPTSHLLLPDSTPYTALFLASWNPTPRPSAVGACAEHQAEGTESSAGLLQF